jgi:hypothetical protein
MQRIQEENPEVPAHILNDCGHFIPLDQPDELNELLGKILAASWEEKQKMNYGNEDISAKSLNR